MAIDEQHPRCEEYVKKCNELFDAYDICIEAARAKYPDWRGYDHPSGSEVRLMERERNQKLKALQCEYHFLFIDD